MTNQQPSLDLMFQALADPSRRGMIERLCAGPASVSELAQPLAMSLPSVMQHLQLLEGAGLVRSEKVGRVRTCRLQPEALSAAETWINQRRVLMERKFDRLEAYLRDTAGDEDQPDPQPHPRRK